MQFGRAVLYKLCTRNIKKHNYSLFGSHYYITQHEQYCSSNSARRRILAAKAGFSHRREAATFCLIICAYPIQPHNTLVLHSLAGGLVAKKSKHDIWLTDGEDLLCAAEASGDKHPKTLLLTNKRLILIEEIKAKEWSDTDDKMWKQFSAVKLAQGFWNSTLTVSFSDAFDAELWTFKKVNKDTASQAYRMMKNREVALREAGKTPAPAPVKPISEAIPQEPVATPPPALAPAEEKKPSTDNVTEATAQADDIKPDEPPKKSNIINKLFHKNR